MRRTKCKKIMAIMIVILCLSQLPVNVTAKRKYIDFWDYNYYCDGHLNSGLKNMKRLAKKLGLKQKKSKKYKSYFAKGKKVKIGYNTHPTMSPYRPLCDIVNNGNKRFTYRNIRIGMTKAKCRSILGDILEKTKNKDTAHYVHGLTLTLYYNSKGKLRKWTYHDRIGPE